MKVRFKRIITRARCPQKSTVGSAYYDLFAARNVWFNRNLIMSAQNNSVPEYVPDNLPWHEHDGLLTYLAS